MVSASCSSDKTALAPRLPIQAKPLADTMYVVQVALP